MFKKFSGRKSFSVFFLSIFAFVFLIQLSAAVVLFLMPQPTRADYTLPLQVPIPTLHGGSKTITFTSTSGTGPIADYVKAIYTYAVGAVGIVAAVVLMIGGLMWITAGGNASNVSEAKAMITASLTGLVLVLVSYLMLNQINPALVSLQAPGVTPPNIAASQTQAPASVCDWVVQTNNPGFGVTGGCFFAGETSDAPAKCTKTMPTSADPNTTYQCCCSWVKDPSSSCHWSTGPVNSQVVVSNDGSDYCQTTETFYTGNDAVERCGTAGHMTFCCCPK
jgi:hypothetical protein